MKIAVCIKQTPASQEVGMDPETGVLLRQNAAAVLNPYDLYAIETALQIAGKTGGSTTALSMGPAGAAAVIREAFALGVDEGFLLCDGAFAGSDVYATSYVLAKAALHLGPFDLILCGRQTTDGDTAQVGPALAAHLGLPFAGWVSSIAEVGDNYLTVEHGATGGSYTLRLPTPCVLAVDRDIFQPRLPTARQKIAAKRREVPLVTLSDLPGCNPAHCGLDGSPTRVRRLFFPQREAVVPPIAGTPEQLAAVLYGKLRELKVLQD